MNIYYIQTTRTIDGDTTAGHLLLADLDEMKLNRKFRLYGVDTPERGQEGYLEAKFFVAERCNDMLLEANLYGKDSFGRFIVDIFFNQDGVRKSLSQALIDEGLGTIYKG